MSLQGKVSDFSALIRLCLSLFDFFCLLVCRRLDWSIESNRIDKEEEEGRKGGREGGRSGDTSLQTERGNCEVEGGEEVVTIGNRHIRYAVAYWSDSH